MKTLFRRTAAAVLSAILLTTVLPLFSASGFTPGHEVVPTVHVTGIASRDIVRYPGTDHEEVLFPPTADQIIAAMDKQTCLSLAAFAVTGNWDRLADALIPAANKVLAGIAFNPDGTPKPDVGINWSYGGPIGSYTKDSRFGFYYDWRLDPMDIAKDLDRYIDYVRAGTGHEKVNIEAFSMGSVILMAYIQQFGDAKIQNIVLSAPACNGVKCAGEPFNGQIEFSPLAMCRYVDTMMSDNPDRELAAAVAQVLYKTGVLGIAGAFADELVEQCADRVYEEVMMQTFGSMPGMWSLIPDEFYVGAKAKVITDPALYAGLIERIDNYHYNVQRNIGRFIDSAIADGIHFGIVAKYGNQITPVIESWDEMNDAVIDTRYASFGATCSTLEGTLGDGYIQAVDDGHNHLSADGQIDASTCAYPEQTWFVRELFHMHGCADYDRLITYILYAPQQVTVFDNPAYPQFLLYDEAAQTLSPLTAPPQPAQPLWGIFGSDSFIFALVRLLRAIFARI